MSLMQPILRQWNRITGGGGEFSVTVPVMDGPLKPNDAIERTTRLASLPGAANLAAWGDALIFSRGREVLSRDAAGAVSALITLDAEVSALAVGPRGEIAIGVSGQGVVIRGTTGDTRRLQTAGNLPLSCVTALCFMPDGRLAIANGSTEVAPAEWARDLLIHGATGLVACATPETGTVEVLADGLRFPAGLCPVDGAADRLAVSEAWAHRVIEISVPGRKVTRTLIDQLPSYPSRICARSGGGYVLSNYSVRSQLVEFILHEKRFLRRMRQEVAPEFWIAPSLRSGDSFKEPLQAGGVIRLGIHKPWSPTRSYGLLIGLSADFQPVWSAHSRADGRRHGVTSVVEWDGGLAALAQGNGDLVALDSAGRPLTDTPHTEAEG